MFYNGFSFHVSRWDAFLLERESQIKCRVLWLNRVRTSKSESKSFRILSLPSPKSLSSGFNIGASFGADQASPAVVGRTLFCCDEYSDRDGQTIYVYARHRTNPVSFFGEFNAFFDEMLSGDYAELRGKSFPMVFNINGQIRLEEQELPYLPHPSLVDDVRFFRIDLPFGPLTIEFGDVRSDDSGLIALNENQMPNSTDSPLLGCDFSAGFTYLPILTKLHWAADILAPNLLSALASGAAQAVSYA